MIMEIIGFILSILVSSYAFYSFSRSEKSIYDFFFYAYIAGFLMFCAIIILFRIAGLI